MSEEEALCAKEVNAAFNIETFCARWYVLVIAFTLDPEPPGSVSLLWFEQPWCWSLFPVSGRYCDKPEIYPWTWSEYAIRGFPPLSSRSECRNQACLRGDRSLDSIIDRSPDIMRTPGNVVPVTAWMEFRQGTSTGRPWTGTFPRSPVTRIFHFGD